MKNYVTFLFLCCTLAAFSQPEEKKGSFMHYFRMQLFHPDSLHSTDLLAMSGTFWIGEAPPPVVADTFVYQMNPFDSVLVHFGLYDDLFMMGYDAEFPFGEQLIYGTPVYDEASYYHNIGHSYHHDWTFQDSALFRFSMQLGPSAAAFPTHYIKLIGPPEIPAPAVVEEPEPAAPFLVFPNPCNDELTILQPEDLITRFELVDASGRTIREWYAAGTQTVDVSTLQSGMYLLRVRNSVYPGTVRVQKI